MYMFVLFCYLQKIQINRRHFNLFHIKQMRFCLKFLQQLNTLFPFIYQPHKNAIDQLYQMNTDVKQNQITQYNAYKNNPLIYFKNNPCINVSYFFVNLQYLNKMQNEQKYFQMNSQNQMQDVEGKPVDSKILTGKVREEQKTKLSINFEQNNTSDIQQNQSESIEQNNDKRCQKVVWTLEQEELLLSLYQQYGPTWTVMTPKFPNKAEISLKNKFNSYLRKAIKVLGDHQRLVLKKLNKGISKIIGVMLEFSYQVQKTVMRLRLTTNPESLLFQFRTKILQLCFKGSLFTTKELTDLSILIKALNTKLRCFGAFKRKCVKGWKLSLQNLWIVCQFDKICIEDLTQVYSRLEANGEAPKQKKVCSSSFQLEEGLPDLDESYYQKFNFSVNFKDFDQQFYKVLGKQNIKQSSPFQFQNFD